MNTLPAESNVDRVWHQECTMGISTYRSASQNLRLNRMQVSANSKNFESPQPNNRCEFTPAQVPPPPPPPFRQERISSAYPTLQERPHITGTAYKTRPSHTMMTSSPSNKYLRSQTVRNSSSNAIRNPFPKVLGTRVAPQGIVE